QSPPLFSPNRRINTPPAAPFGACFWRADRLESSHRYSLGRLAKQFGYASKYISWQRAPLLKSQTTYIFRSKRSVHFSPSQSVLDADAPAGVLAENRERHIPAQSTTKAAHISGNIIVGRQYVSVVSPD